MTSKPLCCSSKAASDGVSIRRSMKPQLCLVSPLVRGAPVTVLLRRSCSHRRFIASGNFAQNEIGEPVLDAVLHPGDLLYFPRGWIHQVLVRCLLVASPAVLMRLHHVSQAVAAEDTHSLHLTVSAAQRCSWMDLFERVRK